MPYPFLQRCAVLAVVASPLEDWSLSFGPEQDSAILIQSQHSLYFFFFPFFFLAVLPFPHSPNNNRHVFSDYITRSSGFSMVSFIFLYN